MKKKPIPNYIRNPFAGATDEKQVWKDLMKSSIPSSKGEFLEKARQARLSNKSK